MKPDLEKILSKHTGEEGIYLTHGSIRGSDALDAMKEAWNLAVETSAAETNEHQSEYYYDKIIKNKIQ